MGKQRRSAAGRISLLLIRMRADVDANDSNCPAYVDKCKSEAQWLSPENSSKNFAKLKLCEVFIIAVFQFPDMYRLKSQVPIEVIFSDVLYTQ